ncbi:hypothetical protein FRC17_000824 [Serendipita sp. 399]|nr:hypothetical protein FRC17_000824 [Serendipita sp. 399]
MAHFGAIRAAVAAILKRNLRMKYNVASAMATQIALVLSGIRSGYLVDGMSLRKHDLQLILQHVQDGSPSEIAAIWETTTEQAFFINTFLLKAKLEAESLPLWVSTTNPSQLVPEPHSFQTLLGKIILEPGSLSTISTDQPTDMVPFAAWLLDYPVAYVVTDPEGPFLTNVALQVYDCTLNWQDERFVLPLA